MRKFVKVTESVMTPLEPRRAAILAEECLIELRFVESRSEKHGWLYEYEATGEVGRVEKFFIRLKDIEQKRS
ncbi:hypothetical protein [Sporomusa acidovorans]|uniref:PepSY domain-containing protein n=1 Tax=Sporomusa acidovorans (strain ATCC 49682 / DSM 3132 / Mol) TaxID=1123286 RepID=A0ABZ3J0C0_SPOA4|nr:hypothetical protein [Sporomusa acidovorans]OZC22840.1 hypothetical protein SPACI_11510 [Sporomusa acidovorans DSM 3132]SDE52682.1 hypothetical protein SAMN04488499_101587 [Sporomusa acidovorans]